MGISLEFLMHFIHNNVFEKRFVYIYRNARPQNSPTNRLTLIPKVLVQSTRSKREMIWSPPSLKPGSLQIFSIIPALVTNYFGDFHNSLKIKSLTIERIPDTVFSEFV